MSFSVPVNLIRQWCYCPRVVYYMELANVAFYRPTWVKQGGDFHKLEKKLWKRRNLSRFKLKEGRVYHNLMLKDEYLSLHGIVDMAVETDDTVYAIEFKMRSHSKNRGHQLQLVAYAMLLEKKFSKPSPVGFLICKGKTLYEIDTTLEKRHEVLQIKQNIQKVMSLGVKPETSATVTQCCNCEYINFCNDR